MQSVPLNYEQFPWGVLMNVNESDSYRIEIIILCMFVKVYRSVGYYEKHSITVALVISRKSCFPKYNKGNFVTEKGFYLLWRSNNFKQFLLGILNNLSVT